MLITGNQLRAARALAGVDQQAVARAANVAVNTIRNMEGRGPNPITSGAVTVRSVQNALEAAGIEFTNGDLPGVRMRPWQTGEMVRLRQASQGHASTLGIGPKEVAVIEEWKTIPGQVPGGHFRLRLASGTILQGLSASHFERVPTQEMEGR